MSADLSQRLVPDGLWELVAPLLPSFSSRPQGGGTAPLNERAVFTAVVYVLTSGCAWRHLPETFGVSPATAHRRFTAWTEAGLWRRLHRAVLDELGARGELDWTSAIVDAASVRAKRGSLTGPNPVDRGKKGSKLHVLSEAQGLPLAVAVSGANLHDSQAFKPLILGIPAVRSRRGPRRRRPVKIRADKAYYSAEHLRWLRARNLVPRIARPGIESGERLGRHRWKIERSISWLFGYRRLTVRYERKGSHFLAFLGLAAALTCYKRLAKITT
ncbi:IS5 family transposase [Streptomyces sp. NBC_01217]|uniref:IS5 family transposase n=1 Tax=Streptomyces sp. NBC_01217 TaxID=2903779 RepID=UPI002E153AD6|nr:IS5 family transposase [Streptomyces sp. NBC_01217]WSQ61192.1 IS5 family transposase [Streptomyces sp. NBC_01217]WSQ61731.1 IS5 family transposase [Streptomyces sp. NBC_01217]WSQ61757.1 IS5 family transposase [Streptomyces sp. NBC_01217]